MTTLHLHVGIHKTASTYIQHRLKSNQAFLKKNSIFYPSYRADHLSLLKSFRKQQLEPWQLLLERAARDRHDHILISAESFSLAMSGQSESPGIASRRSNIQWLSEALSRHRCSLRVYAFVREQGEYLVSRYTQLIKRFYFSLDFPSYVSRVVAGGSESECDYHLLFADALDNPDIACAFIPFIKGSADPCESLLTAMQFEGFQNLKPLQSTQANVQPGWRAVWIAQRVAQRLRRQDPVRWKNPAIKAALRSKLENTAQCNGWTSEPFSELTQNLRGVIHDRYSCSNDAFARQVWGCSWSDIFPEPSDEVPGDSARISLSSADKQLLRGEAESLLQYGLSLKL